MSVDSNVNEGGTTHEISDRVIRLPEVDGLIGKAKVTKPFTVTTRRDADEFVCDGPFGLLLQARGKTENEAMERYLQFAADQYVFFNSEDKSTVVAYAEHVRDQLENHLTYLRWDKQMGY